jgi:hypothetical protein
MEQCNSKFRIQNKNVYGKNVAQGKSALSDQRWGATELAMTGRQDGISDVLLSLRGILNQLDELDLSVPAIKVAEAIDVLAPSSDQLEQTPLTEIVKA